MASTGGIGGNSEPNYGDFSFGEDPSSDPFESEDSFDMLGDIDFETYITQPGQEYTEKKVFLSPERFKQLNPEMDLEGAFASDGIEAIALRRFDDGSAQIFGLEDLAGSLEGLNVEFQDLDDMGELVTKTFENYQFTVVKLNKEQYSKISRIASNAISQASSAQSEKGIEGIKKKNIQSDSLHIGTQKIHELSTDVITNSSMSRLSSKASENQRKQEIKALEEFRSIQNTTNALDEKSKKTKSGSNITDNIKKGKNVDVLGFEKKKGDLNDKRI